MRPPRLSIIALAAPIAAAGVGALLVRVQLFEPHPIHGDPIGAMLKLFVGVPVLVLLLAGGAVLAVAALVRRERWPALAVLALVLNLAPFAWLLVQVLRSW